MNQEQNNLEDKIGELSKTCYSTLKESALIAKKYGLTYINGLITIPYILLATPTFISEYKRSSDERKEFIKKYGDNLDNYNYSEMGVFLVGLINSIQIIVEKYQPMMDYVFNHPYLLATPIITNIISAGYEKQKKNKELKKERYKNE